MLVEIVVEVEQVEVDTNDVVDDDELVVVLVLILMCFVMVEFESTPL